MSRPSTTSTNSVNAFPRPAGVNLLAPETVAEHLSPSRSTFSFESSPKSHLEVERNQSFEDRRVAGHDVHAAAAGGLKQNGSRRRAQYYEEQFAYKDDAVSSARDRVTRDSPVIAELRTNVIVRATNTPEIELLLTRSSDQG